MKKLYLIFIAIFLFGIANSIKASEQVNTNQKSLAILNLDDFLSQDENQRQKFIRDLKTALAEEGFFALYSHQIKESNVENAYAAANRFFSLPLEVKKQYEGIALNRGYKSFKIDRKDKVPDLQEYWHVGRENSSQQQEDLIEPNVWPNISNFKAPMLALYKNLDSTGKILLQAISLAMGENSNFLESITAQGDSVMRVIHYLPNLSLSNSSLSWKAPHRDPNLLTIIAGITHDGLEIQLKDGNWLSVAYNKDVVIVSTSNMLENLSNGLFRSTPHRVVQKYHGERYAIPFFIHVKRDVNIGPRGKALQMTGGIAKYPYITAREALKNHKWFKSLQELNTAPMH